MNEFNQQPNFLFEFPGVSFRKVALPASFITPPFSVPLQSFTVNPGDINSTPQSANSGDVFYDGLIGHGIENPNVEPTVQFEAFEANTAPDVLPPDDNVAPNVAGFFIAAMFWAGGSLQLFITANNSQSFYRNRLAHYTLSLTGGDWSFIYQPASSQLLRNFIVPTAGLNRHDIHRYKSGVSYFLQANNSVAFGDLAGFTTGINTNIRISISDTGVFELSDYTIPAPGTLRINAVLGDTVGITATGSTYEDLGVIDGGRYFRPSPSNDFVLGYPLPSYPSISTIPNLRNYNMYVNRLDQRDNLLFHGLDELFRYTPRQNNDNIIMYASWGETGGLLYRVLIDGVCPNSVDGLCSVVEEVNLCLMYFKESFDAEPVLLNVQKQVPNSTFGDAHFIQNNTSNEHAVDTLGNQLNMFGTRAIYRQAQSSVSVNLASILPVSASSVRNKPAATPYGFALIATTSGTFATGTNRLIFIQSNVS